MPFHIEPSQTEKLFAGSITGFSSVVETDKLQVDYVIYGRTPLAEARSGLITQTRTLDTLPPKARELITELENILMQEINNQVNGQFRARPFEAMDTLR